MEKELCIVVPCYNELNRLSVGEFSNFLEDNDDVRVCFVNDGSIDGTLAVLNELKGIFPHKVSVLPLLENHGKGEAVRKGFHYCLDHYNPKYLAYLDADLAVSLPECKAISLHITEKVSFVFGSRIMKIGSIIIRKRSRFLIGRLIATLISLVLGLKVYDTQCGCKIFKGKLAKILFDKPFLSKWLFDVELFQRMISLHGKEKAISKMEEVPLSKWIDKGSSKVRATYFFKLWLDLFRIYHLSRKKKKIIGEKPIIIEGEVQKELF